MGYTHYFRQQRSATPTEWEAITKGFTHLQTAALLTKAFPIQRNDGDPSPTLVDTDEVFFNGIKDAGHETMILSRIGSGFRCCKTNRKPYDRAVVALLVLAHYHAHGCWIISSDGDPKDWQPTLDWMNSLGIGKFTMPFEDYVDA